MEYNVYNSSNLFRTKTITEPVITFLACGKILLTQSLMNFLELKENSGIEFFQNKDGDWYLCPNDNKYSLKIRMKDRTKTGVIFSKGLVKLLDGGGFRCHILKQFITHENKKLYLILTKDKIIINSKK
jgi:hypothetical protein